MTLQHSRRPPLWARVARSLRPTYGARRNAAEGIEDVRRGQAHRAQAVAAFHAAGAVPEQRSVSGRAW